MLIKQDFYFHALDANRPLHIRVPDEGDGPFPVMYFFDGHNLFLDEDATYGKSWGLDEYCRAWDKPVIIVGVECGHGEGERLSEYLPYSRPQHWLQGLEPRGDATMQAIVNELKPWVDAHFPTMPFRECTAIGGSSMGGIMSLFALVRYNHIFSKAACLSPAIGPVASSLWREMNATALSPDTRAYLAWGTLETGKNPNPWEEDRSSGIYRNCRAAANKIEAQGGAAMLYCQIGGRHCEADWEKQLGIFMPFLWQS